MKIMARLTLKEILNNKKNFTLCFISVLLSCILLFTVGLAFSTIRQNQINSIIDNYGDYHAIIYDAYINEKNNLDNKLVNKYYYIYQIEDNLYSISDNFDLNLDIKGRLPNNSNEILISSNKANELKLDIDSNLEINSKSYKVVGIYKKNYFLNFTFDDIILTKDTEDNNKAVYFIYLDSYNNMNLDLDLLVSKFNNASIYKNKTLISYFDKSDTSTQNQVYMLLTMFLCLILAFIIFFIIYNAFSISVNEKKKKYAMYKSIGATPKQILCSVFLESLIVLVVAIPLGFLLSLGFVSLILFIINNMLEGIAPNIYTLEMYPTFIFISLIFILVSTLLATFSVARMASRINIIDEVRQNKKFKYRKSNKLIKKLLGIECLISANNVTRDRAKYRITTISVVIGIILFLTSTTLLSIALYSFEDSYTIQNYAYLNYVESDLNNITTEHIFEYIDDLDSVKEYIFDKSGYYNYQTIDDKTGNIIVAYIDTRNYEKLKEKYQFDEAIIFNVLDDGKQVFEQESISLTLNPTSNYANQESFDVTAKVINESGFLEDIYPGVYTTSFLPIMVLEQENQIDYISHIYIVSDDYLKLDQEIQELVENNKIYYANYPAMYHNQVVTSNCIKLIIYLALLFITFITVVSIIGTISASLNLRRKEFAILKSIGLSNKQFNKMIFYESLMLSLKSLLFGILLFILIVSIFIKITMINDATYEGLLQIPLNIYLTPLLICIIGVIVIVYLSFLIATHKIKKDNIVDVIKFY